LVGSLVRSFVREAGCDFSKSKSPILVKFGTFSTDVQHLCHPQQWWQDV